MLHRLRDLLAHVRAGHRIGCETCASVWARIEADPVAVASIRQGREDIEAGRWYHFDTETGESTPNPDWPKDGPQPTSTDFWRYESPSSLIADPDELPQGPVGEYRESGRL